MKKGAVVNARLLSSSRRPRRVIDQMPEDREEEKSQDKPSYEVSYCADQEASWIRKPPKKGQGGLLEERKKQLIPSSFAEK